MDTQQIFVYRIAAQFGIRFPVNRVHVEIELTLVLRRKQREVVDRFVGLANPLVLQKVPVLPQGFKFFIRRNRLLLRLDFP